MRLSAAPALATLFGLALPNLYADPKCTSAAADAIVALVVMPFNCTGLPTTGMGVANVTAYMPGYVRSPGTVTIIAGGQTTTVKPKQTSARGVSFPIPWTPSDGTTSFTVAAVMDTTTLPEGPVIGQTTIVTGAGVTFNVPTTITNHSFNTSAAGPTTINTAQPVNPAYKTLSPCATATQTGTFGSLLPAGTYGSNTTVVIHAGNVPPGATLFFPSQVQASSEATLVVDDPNGNPSPGPCSYAIFTPDASGNAQATYSLTTANPWTTLSSSVRINWGVSTSASTPADITTQLEVDVKTANDAIRYWTPPSVAATLSAQAANNLYAENAQLQALNTNLGLNFTYYSEDPAGCPSATSIRPAAPTFCPENTSHYDQKRQNTFVTTKSTTRTTINAATSATTVKAAGAGARRPLDVTTSSWLTISANSPGTPATLTFTVNAAGLSPGVYTTNVTVSGQTSAFTPVTFPVTLTVNAPGPWITPGGAGSAANYIPLASPGLPMTIFGEGFGPGSLATAAVTTAGAFDTTAGNTQVFFDGVAAPMIYAARGQVSAIAPFSLDGKTTTQVQVAYQGVKSPPLTIPVSAALPGLLSADSSGGGPGAILNQDYSVNSASKPVAPGGVIQIFAIGAGQTSPAGRDGRVVSDATPPAPKLPATLTVGGQTAQILYAADAPGLVEGVLQVNAILPQGLPSGPNSVVLSVGSYTSPDWVTVAVK